MCEPAQSGTTVSLHSIWIRGTRRNFGAAMLDMIFVAATFVFVCLAILYVRACERLL